MYPERGGRTLITSTPNLDIYTAMLPLRTVLARALYVGRKILPSPNNPCGWSVMST